MLRLFTFIFVIGFLACNSENKKTETKTDSQQSLADSLENEVMDGHDVGMSKYGKLKSMKFEAERLLDSISKLPAKAREAAEPLKIKLDALVRDLGEAKDGMDKWMREFDMDSAVNDTKARIDYLTSEKLKVGKVKESILQTLQRADSLLRKNL